MTNNQRKIKFWNRFAIISPWLAAIPFVYNCFSAVNLVLKNPYYSTPELVQIGQVDENLRDLTEYKRLVSSFKISFDFTDKKEIVDAGNEILGEHSNLLTSCSNLEAILKNQRTELTNSLNFRLYESENAKANMRLKRTGYLLPATAILALGLGGLGASMSCYYRKKSKPRQNTPEQTNSKI